MPFGKPKASTSRFGKRTEAADGPKVIGDLKGVQVGLSEYKGQTNVALAGGAAWGRPLFLNYEKLEWLAANAGELFKRLTAMGDDDKF